MAFTLETDIAVIGGGIAGLWLNYRLRRAGYSTLLFEKKSLGGGQSVRSQGIIHGGTKYALTGALTPAADAIGDMPERWRACLKGSGDIDLSSAKILSEYHYMWSRRKLASKITTFFASKAVRGRISDDANEHRPEVFNHPRFKGNFYALNELVLDVPSVVSALTSEFENGLYELDCSQPGVVMQENNNVRHISVGAKHKEVKIVAQRYILAAGEGNESVLHGALLEGPAMQRRPLHMVIVKHNYPHPVYAHCISTGTKPLVTITTHYMSDGQPVWYLGGALAESGVEREPEKQISKARKLLADLLPWVELGESKWASFLVNRAEPQQSSLTRPDSAYVNSKENVIICWPTKLALTPDLADEVFINLERDNIKPQFATDYEPLKFLSRPPTGKTVWEEML